MKATKAEGGRWALGLPPGLAAISHHLALKGEAFGQSAAQNAVIARIVLVIAKGLAGRCDVQPMVYVVVPLGGEIYGFAVIVAEEKRAVVILILDDQVDMPIRSLGADPAGKFVEQMLFAVVLDGVGGVQAQAVEPVLPEPIDGVLDHELSNLARSATVEIHRISPGRFDAGK